MRKVCAVATLVVLLAVWLTGCIPPAEPLTEAQMEDVARRYNAVPTGAQTEFDGTVPLEYGIYYFVVCNHLGSADCPDVYRQYAVNQESGVLARYEVPKAEVERYISQFFTAVDTAAEQSRFRVKDDRYVLYGSNGSVDPVPYTVRDAQVAENTLTFLCDIGDLEGDIRMTQQFTMQSDHGIWKIHAVHTLYTKEQSY